MYRDMVLQRRFEEEAGRAYGMGKIYGFCHLYIGQEAISTGCTHAMEPGDVVVSAYRIHAQALAAGIPPQAVMDELFGRATGNVGGKGGSMHMYDVERGFWGGWGLVGQQVPMACGVAFARRYEGRKDVTLAFFGDGAINQGAIHESFNLAAIWNLPIVFVVENNGWGMGTAVDRVCSIRPLHGMAEAYGFDHMAFDGMDVLASHAAFDHAIRHAREQSRPFFLEARCSRFRGHSMSDPGKYRSREQLEEEKALDPIPRLGAVLVEQGHATDEALQAIDREIRAAMKEVARRAEQAPWPEPGALWTHVLADSPTEAQS
jgi:pyruvate dehydrogenase E1 component alpha subunit